jgi:mycothione reductase
MPKDYDLIIIGTGSAMNLVDPMIEQNPKIKIAVIDKDKPGGICLTRGCIPSKILLYPAELVRLNEEANELGVKTEIMKIDFKFIMDRMRNLIGKDIDSIRQGLSNSENIDYYHDVAEFVAPYTLKIKGEEIKSKMIILCIGSETTIPPVKGLEKISYLTSDSVLELTQLPENVAIVGGGYIAAEYGHFLSSMGSKVTIIGRNARFLPDEEPEVGELAKKELSKHMTVLTNHEVKQVEEASGSKNKKLTAVDRGSKKEVVIEAQQIMIAAGRSPTTKILHPEKAGIKTTREGWIEVNDYLETSQPGIWALGDADGKYPFKHVANYESGIVYYNALLKKKIKADYHAIPHAVFTYPEVAGVGLKEKEAVEKYGEENVLIGFYKYENTAKGEAMNVRDYFVKVVVEKTGRILGASIIGPYASILIQEIINVMYTQEQSAQVINDAIHIHPALNEVVQRAFSSLMPVEHYHHMTEDDNHHEG